MALPAPTQVTRLGVDAAEQSKNYAHVLVWFVWKSQASRDFPTPEGPASTTTRVYPYWHQQGFLERNPNPV